MGTWTWHAWTSGNSTAAASGVTLSSSSALVFGGGARSDFQSNITLENWNTALHWGASTAEATTDICQSPHLWPIYPLVNNAGLAARDTGCSLAGTYINMANGTPNAARGIGMRFTHTFGVKCNPVTIWAGTGAAVGSPPENCYIAMCDLTSSQPQWSTVNPSSTLTLKKHAATAAEEHWWTIGVAVCPLVVGLEDNNKIRVNCTYY